MSEEILNGKKLIREEGNRYGKLVVIERVGSKTYPSGQTKPIWLCQCDCGNTTETSAQGLRAGQVKSCGCARYDLDKDWVGTVQGKLTVVSRAEDKITKRGYKAIRWLCKCECGNTKILRSTALKNGSNSCGCEYNREKHGHTVDQKHSPTFASWWSMMQRCLNVNHEAYKLYGAVGVEVEESWKDFPTFLADMGERPEGCTLNRINSAMIYSKETCEWATLSIQAYDQKKRSTNKSGKTGVCWDKRLDKWEAYISVDRKKISLGFSEVLEEAIELRKKAEIKYYGWNKE